MRSIFVLLQNLAILHVEQLNNTRDKNLFWFCVFKGEVAKKADLIKSFEDIPSGDQTEICKIILAKVGIYTMQYDSINIRIKC